MPGGTNPPGEGKVMKVLRANGVWLPPSPPQDFWGLKTIMVVFIAGIVACAGICAVTIIRDAALHSRHAQHADTPVQCTCMGRCLRH